MVRIQDEYKRFTSSSQTLEQYFNRVIIEAKEAEKSKLVYIRPTEITGVPVFFVKNKQKKLITGWSLSDLKSRKPIKMDMANIFKMFGKPYEPFEFCSAPDFLEMYGMEKNKAIIDNSLPGESKVANKIMVAFENGVCHWVPNSEQIVTIYRCERLPGKCLYSTEHETTFKAHKCSDQTEIHSKSRSYGQPNNSLAMAIDHGILPVHFRDFRQKYLSTFDLETLEQDPESFVEGQQAVHKVASIALASNLPGISDRFFIRDSSDPEDGQSMVDQFLDALFEMEQKYQEMIPDEIHQAFHSLADVEEDVFNVDRTQKQQLKRFLKNYLQFPCYGFNSGKLFNIIGHVSHFSRAPSITCHIGHMSHWSRVTLVPCYIAHASLCSH